jgi:inosine-uridine nucleoside N-ribohydrolase
MQKVILDADPGIADAVAIAVALADPHLDVLALTAVGGRVPVAQAGRNLVSLIEALDPPKRPRIGINDSPDAAYDFVRFSERMGDEVDLNRQLNGETGLGDWLDRGAELHSSRGAAKLFLELTREYPGQIALITLGPLTSVALACEMDHEFLGRLQRLVCLGGTCGGPGDVTPAAEYNIAFNPEAARKVLRSPATKQLVPLDVGRQVVLSFEQLQRLELDDSRRTGRLLKALLPFGLRAHHQHLGMEGMCLPDLAALAAVACPRLFAGMTVALDVETEGHLTRGATVLDRRPKPRWRPNIDVLTDVDAQGVLDYLATTIAAAG